MLDVVTTALESAAVLLVVVALGWTAGLLIPAPLNGPAAVAVAGVAAGAASWALGWLAARVESAGAESDR